MNDKVLYSREGRRTQIDRAEYQALREAIEAAMVRSGIGQRELSRKLNKPFVYINRILNARRTLEFAEFLDICDAIGVDPLEVFATAIRTSRPQEG